MTFKWVKGHQDDVPFNVSPEIHMNNRCDELANIERDDKTSEIDISSLNLNMVIERMDDLLLGDVKKDIDDAKNDERLTDCWNNRGFYKASNCKIDLRREVMRKNFKLRTKMLNGTVPTHERVKMCDSMHADVCPMCNEEIEDWKHVLRCKRDGIKEKFLHDLKIKLVEIKKLQMQSMIMMEKTHKLINKKSESDADEIEFSRLFLGWISSSWIKEENMEASKWCKRATKENVQHMVSSWEERNEKVHGNKKHKEHLIKRLIELEQNKEMLETDARDFVEKVLKSADRCSFEMLSMDYQILLSKAKKKE